MRAIVVAGVMMGVGCGTEPDLAPQVVTGHVTTSTTWSGTTELNGDVFIDPGVTITVAPGATLELAQDAGLEVDGVLDAHGTTAEPVAIQPTDSLVSNAMIVIAKAGIATLDHVSQRGIGLDTLDSGALHMIDSKLVNQGGNYFVMLGGSVDVSYSDLGVVGDNDHCIFHLNPGNNTIAVTHSNILGSQYALMFDGGTNADFKSNNWIGNGIDIETTPGNGVSGDFSYGFFANSPPVPTAGNTLVLEQLATSALVDAGARL